MSLKQLCRLISFILLLILISPGIIIADGPLKGPPADLSASNGGKDVSAQAVQTTVQLAPNDTKTLTYSVCNYAYYYASYTMVESPAADWLSIDPTSGNVPPRTCVQGNVNFDATDKQDGLYDTRIYVTGGNWSPSFFDISMEVVPIEVTNMTPCIVGPYYFEPIVSAGNSNDYTVNVNWGLATPGHLEFLVNGNTAETPADGAEVTYALDMDDLNYSLLVEENIIEVVAVSDLGGKSEPFAFSPGPYGVTLPPWVPGANLEFSYPDVCNNSMKVTGDFEFPKEPLKTSVTPPNWIPFVGGEKTGMDETQLTFNTTFIGNGTLTAKGGVKTKFEIARQSIAVGVTGGGSGNVEPNSGVQTTAELDLYGRGKIEIEEQVVDALCKAVTVGVCRLETAESWPFVGSTVRWFNRRAIVQAILEPHVDFNFKFEGDKDELEFKAGTALLKTKATLALIIRIIEGSLEFSGYGGGEIGTHLQVPAPYLKKVETDLFFGLKATVWDYEYTFQASYPSCIGNCGSLKQTHPFAGTDTGWIPISRDYAKTANDYSRFLSSPVTPTNSLTIATNVFPHNHPTIATHNDETLLVWVHDDINKPQLQGKELYFTLISDTVWLSPTAITSDTLQDFNPSIAFDGQGQAVAVWERNKTVQLPSAELDAPYINAFEIAYAVWDGISWSAPLTLTNNAVLDHAPKLVRGNDGNLLLTWRENNAGELIGSNANPDQIYYAVWNGLSWSASELLLANAADVLGIAPARFDDNQMDVIYSLDTDHDLSTPNDQELYHLSYNGLSWSAPTALTTDAIADSSPSLFYSSTGQPRLLWLKGEQLYAIMDDWLATPTPVISEEKAGMLAYNAAQDTEGNLVLSWQANSEEGVDIYYAAYDELHNSFSFNRQLTYDEPLEKYMDTAYIAPGEMIIAFDKTELITTEMTVLTHTIPGVTVFGQSDLHLLRHSFGRDLIPQVSAVQADAPFIQNAGQLTVTITISNAGDWAVENPQVDFLYGSQLNPQGVALAPITAPITLVGGMTTTITSLISVTEGDVPYYLDITVDKVNAIAEWDESNNYMRYPFMHFVYLPLLNR